MPKVPRDYQEAAIAAHYTWLSRPGVAPLIVAPTGSGKSLIIAEFLCRSLRAWPETRAIVLTHVRELVEQDYKAFVDQWDEPLSPAGIYSAGLGRRDTRDSIIFASIQSVWRRAEELGSFDLVLADESHLWPKKGMGRYRTYLEALRKINPDVRIVGYTATPYRLDGGYLHVGEGSIFTHIAYEIRMEDLIESGHLVPLVAKRAVEQIDLTGVKIENGEFKLNQMEAAARKDGAVAAAVSEIVDRARRGGRKSWLVFTSGVDHALDVLKELHSYGVSAKAVFGHTHPDERAEHVKAFRDGRLTCLVNVLCLTTGFDAPRCDLLVMLRATASTSLYVQCLGRGARPFTHEDGTVKANCLVLDYGGNVERHGPVNHVRPRQKGNGGRSSGSEPDRPSVKVCPQCQTFAYPSAKVCDECGYRWPEKHAAVASNALAFDPHARDPRILEVQTWHFERHEKRDRPPSMRVDYLAGRKRVSEWVCFEHKGYAQGKANKWWLEHSGRWPPPRNVVEALGRLSELRKPLAIEVVDDGDFERIRRPIYRMEAAENQVTTPDGVA